MIRISHLVVTWAWVAFGVSFAQKPQFRFEAVTVDQGLSQNNVYCILQDEKGFIWLGAKDGLNRFDGADFLIFKHDPEDPHSISDSYIWAIREDLLDPRYLWIGTQNGGLNRYDRETRRFQHVRRDLEQNLLDHNDIRVIEQDRNGDLFLGTFGAGLQVLRWDENGPQRLNTYRSGPNNSQNISDDRIQALMMDSGGRLWIGTNNGLNVLDLDTGKIHWLLNGPNDPVRLDKHPIRVLMEDLDGAIWIGTEGGGLYRLDPKTGDISSFGKGPEALLDERNVFSLFQEPEAPDQLWVGTGGDGLWLVNKKTGERATYRENAIDPYALKSNHVKAIVKDRTGVIWLGLGAAGAARLNRNTLRFNHFKHNPGQPSSLSDNKVYAVLEDGAGTLWVGSQEGGLDRLDKGSDTFRNYGSDPNNTTTLSQRMVPCIYEDQQRTLWVGTYSGLNRLTKNREEVGRQYLPNPGDSQSLNNGPIYALLEDGQNRFWVGVFGGGLHLMDRENHTFRRFVHDSGDPQSISNDDIRSILEDSEDRFWVGTEGGGLNLMDRTTHRFRHFIYDPKHPDSLSNDNVRCIVETGNHQIWIGTDRGLNRLADLSDVSASFVSYSEKDGLPNPVVYGILEDNQGQLWMSTNRGISRFSPGEERFRNYDVKDGIQGWEFNQGAFFQGADDKMYFGGLNGLTSFYPNRILSDDSPPMLSFTDFLLFHQSSPLKDQNSQSPLVKVIEETSSLTLNYRQDIFTLKFAALHYGKPEGNRFRYRLTPFNDQWIETAQGMANYTNLPAGEYEFAFEGSNADGVWSKEGKTLHIHVKPPPWKTWWAFTCYALAILGGLLAYVFSQARKLANKQSMVERLTQVDKLKDEILANTSHELRTPLNGMIGLAEALLDGAAGSLPEKGVHSLNMIVSCGHRLNSLVNDILDFSKLKSHNLELSLRPLDLRSLTDVVLTLSQPLVNGRNLQLDNAIAPWLPPVMADEDRLLQIMHNLIGNAAKFTDSGTITVSALEKADFIEVRVTDTGIGIPLHKQSRIFESFEQVDGATARVHGGTGLGLAVTKKLVELHGGQISVSSKEGDGSCFHFTLPRASEGVAAQRMSISVNRTQHLSNTVSWEGQTAGVPVSDGGFHILIVDDEPVNRQVLVDHLSLNHYHLTQVASGKEALEKIEAGQEYDLVLLDVMMPAMSGYEVCSKLRETIPVHELPIIFLTARNQVGDLVTGLVSGANDFLTKPISKQELLARVRTHLQLLDVNRNLERMVEKRTQNMNVLGEIGRKITGSLFAEEIYKKVYEHVSQLMDAYHFGIGVYLPESREIQFKLIFEDGEDKKMARMSIDEPNSLAAWCINNRKEIIIEERNHLARYIEVDQVQTVGMITQSIIYMPLIVEDRIVGTLTVQSPQKYAYSSYTRDVIRTLANYTAIALDNASAYKVVAEQNEEILKNRDQLIMQEKMASMGRLSAGIAHELQNPLNFINNFSEVTLELLDESGDLVHKLEDSADSETSALMRDRFDGLVRNLTRIKEHGLRATRIVSGMMDIVKEGPGVLQDARIEKLLFQCMQLSGHQIGLNESPGIVFEEEWEEIGIRRVMTGELSRALLNIFNNAIESIREKQKTQPVKGVIKVSARLQDEKVEMRIKDNGIGIARTELSRVFEPFYTTKLPGDGHVGLGLSLAYEIIVNGHGGSLGIMSGEGRYTEVFITI